MSKKIRNIICFLLTIVLLIAALLFLTRLFERKAAVKQYQDFFEEEENFDVLFMGTSHVLGSVYPMELFKDYGIVSYNMGGNGNMLPTTYWMLQNALDYTSPKLVVIDGLKLTRDMKTSKKYSQCHVCFDAFPLSQTKLMAIRDLLDEEEVRYHLEHDDEEYLSEERVPIGMLWNFSVYHARWEELGWEDFNWEASPEKGAQGRSYVAEAQITGLADPNAVTADSLGKTYLIKMITELKERDIDVLITYLPFPACIEEQIEANTIKQIAEEYEVPYIDFLDLNVINYATDLSDSDSHINFSGGRKVTDYLGQYITEHYDLPDHREDAAFADWYDDYENYRAYKISKFTSVEELDQVLMLLSDKNFDCMIEINSDDIRADVHLREMFYNLGFTVKDLMGGFHYYYVTGGQKVEDFRSITSYHTILTEKGEVEFTPNQEADIRITIYDSQTGETVAEVEF